MAGESRNHQSFLITDFRPGLASEEDPGAIPPGAATEAFNTMPSPSGALAIRPTTRQLDNLGFAFRPDVVHTLLVSGEDGLPDVANIIIAASGATSFIGSYATGARLDSGAMNSHAAAHGANRVWQLQNGPRSLNFPMVPGAFATLHGQTAIVTPKFFGRVGVAQYGTSGQVMPYLHRIWFPLELQRDLTGCIVCVHHGRMFVAGNNSWPTKLRWSHVGEPCPEPSSITDWPDPPSPEDPYTPMQRLGHAFDEAWPKTNYLMVDADQSTNDPISGLVSYGGVLWALTTGAAYQIAGADWDEGEDIRIERVPGAPGCVSPRSVQSNENGIFYMSRSGPWRIDRSRAEAISAQVSRSFDRRQLENSHACLTPERYIVTLPSMASDAQINNAFNVYDSTLSFPSWRAGVATPQPTKVTPGGSETGAEGDVGNFMRWQVNSTSNDTTISPNDTSYNTATGATNNLRYFTCPFSTNLKVRFWVRRPPTGTAWGGSSAIKVIINWFPENDVSRNPDLGGGWTGSSYSQDIVIGGNATGVWNLVDVNASFNWAQTYQPPEAMGVTITILFFGWAAASHVDFDKFQMWPLQSFEPDEPGGLPPPPPLPTDPIEAGVAMSYDRTFVYDIVSGGWARWSLNYNVMTGRQPYAYSKPRPNTQDRFHFVMAPAANDETRVTESWPVLIQKPGAEPLAWWDFTEPSPATQFHNRIGPSIARDMFFTPGTGPAWQVPAHIDTGLNVGTSGLLAMSDPDLQPAAMTLQLWVKLTTWPSAGQVLFLAAWTPDFSSQGWTLTLDGNDSTVKVRRAGGTTLVLTAPAFTVGAWTHVTLTIDTATATLYFNGGAVGTAPSGYAVPTSTCTLYLMVSVRGVIDEAVLHGRVLTGTEVTEFAQAGATTILGPAPPSVTSGGYHALEKRRDRGDKYLQVAGDEGELEQFARDTAWLWTSGCLIPATAAVHEFQLTDSHVNIGTQGDADPLGVFGQGEIEVSSRWNGTHPNPPTVSSIEPVTPTSGWAIERIRSGYLGRGQWGQVHLEGDATNELLIHALDLEAEIDPRP